MARHLSAQHFATIFDSFRGDAFRLETLPHYQVPEERAELASFLAGTPLPSAPAKEWCEFVRQCASAGKTMTRVHVIPRALTPYLRFEIDWGYSYTTAAGEHVYLLDTDSAALNASTRDFWLFDDETLVYMNYDNEGRFLGAEQETDSSAIADHRALRDRLLGSASTLEQFLSTARNA